MIFNLPPELTIRNSRPSDHANIISVLKDWWGGRDLTWMLPKLFLEHFCNTSFVVEKNDRLVAFLIGFRIERGNAEINGIRATLDYNHPGDAKVLFKMTL